MVAKSLPRLPKIQVEESRLDQFKRNFFGPLLARNTPRPDLGTVKGAYVQCWREIVLYMHQNGVGVTSAMDAIEGDGLLLQHLFKPRTERRSHAAEKGARQPPWMASRQSQWQAPYQPPWTGKGQPAGGKYGGGGSYKGYGKYGGGSGGGGGGGKSTATSKGKDKGGKPERQKHIPAGWGTNAMRTPPTAHNSSGQLICFDHHLNGSCLGGCGKSHDMCPKLLAAGRFCFSIQPALGI